MIADRVAKLRRGNGIVWDNHGCLPMRADPSFLPELERYRAAGVNVVSINVGYANMSWAEHLRLLSFMRQWLAVRQDSFRLVATIEDVELAKSEEKLGVVFDVEGMCPVEDNPCLVQTFYELGVRWMLIAYNRNNAAGGGCMDNDCGLTAVGRAIIDEMERVGMVLCLSHTGPRTAADALAYARNPVIFSHSNPYGHTRHDRNISDKLIRQCAEKGGVIGLSGIGPFLGSDKNLVQLLLQQLRYVIDLVGTDHVGISLDYMFDRVEFNEHIRLNPTLYPPGLADLEMIAPEAMNEIAEGLAIMNFADDQIWCVLGENWKRIATLVWK